MTIPGDAENRWWVEASGNNQSLADELRPALIAFVSFSPGGEANIEGTGFITAGDPKAAVVVTAKHALIEGAFRTQFPHPKFDPSSLFIPKKLTKPSIEPKDMKILWMDSNSGLMMDVWHLNYNDTSDIACCVVTFQKSDEGRFKPSSIPIDTMVPCEGELIHMVSLDNLTHSTEHLGNGKRMKLSRRMSIRCGVVTGVYPKGFRQYRWPCFTTSIPAEPGMSGGLVALPEAGKTVAACGIVCADNSTEEARSDFSICGESVVASAWAMLGMKLPVSYPSIATTPQRSLYEYMLSGDIPMAVGGIDMIDIIELEDGDYRIKHN
jgi:hypothetical protein